MTNVHQQRCVWNIAEGNYQGSVSTNSSSFPICGFSSDDEIIVILWIFKLVRQHGFFILGEDPDLLFFLNSSFIDVPTGHKSALTCTNGGHLFVETNIWCGWEYTLHMSNLHGISTGRYFEGMPIKWNFVYRQHESCFDEFTHCDLVTSYDDIDLDLHWPR